jgi:hypothetical protein
MFLWPLRPGPTTPVALLTIALFGVTLIVGYACLVRVWPNPRHAVVVGLVYFPLMLFVTTWWAIWFSVGVLGGRSDL